jgi:hypothetical protein
MSLTTTSAGARRVGRPSAVDPLSLSSPAPATHRPERAGRNVATNFAGPRLPEERVPVRRHVASRGIPFAAFRQIISQQEADEEIVG